jgi:hypothetical protein
MASWMSSMRAPLTLGIATDSPSANGCPDPRPRQGARHRCLPGYTQRRASRLDAPGTLGSRDGDGVLDPDDIC